MTSGLWLFRRITPRHLSSCALAALTVLSSSGSSESWTAAANQNLVARNSASGTCSAMSTASVDSSTFELAQFQCLSDNYGYLLHDATTGYTAAVDTPSATNYKRELTNRGWKLTHIFNTHHHFDHTGGNLELKTDGVVIYGPKNEKERIPGIDKAVGGGDILQFGPYQVHVIDVGGHTKGHIAYYIPELKSAWVGDSLFAIGCGKMSEGTPDQNWASLLRIRNLPDDTLIYW